VHIASFSHVFSELYVFVITDPAALEEVALSLPDRNLAKPFTTTTLGDEVTSAGIAVPLDVTETGYYTVRIEVSDSPAPAVEGILEAPVVHARTGELIWTNLGALHEWDPTDHHHQRFRVPPGRYRLASSMVELDPEDLALDDFSLTLTMTPADEQASASEAI
jgi:hypothetical protein